MTQHGIRRNRQDLRRFFRAAELPADNILVFESCSRMPTLAAQKRLASSIRGTALRLPFGSTVESWPPQPSACPRPSPHAVPRIDDASRFLWASYSSAYPGRNSRSTSPKAARAFSCERTASPPSHTRWMSR
jgi:hypothetical protein